MHAYTHTESTTFAFVFTLVSKEKNDGQPMVSEPIHCDPRPPQIPQGHTVGDAWVRHCHGVVWSPHILEEGDTVGWGAYLVVSIINSDIWLFQFSS